MTTTTTHIVKSDVHERVLTYCSDRDQERMDDDSAHKMLRVEVCLHTSYTGSLTSIQRSSSWIFVVWLCVCGRASAANIALLQRVAQPPSSGRLVARICEAQLSGRLDHNPGDVERVVGRSAAREELGDELTGAVASS
jgi:hypothetical protein